MTLRSFLKVRYVEPVVAPEDSTLRQKLSAIAEPTGRVNSAAVAEAAIAQNFHISFSGILTFKNAAQIKDVAASIPLERILIETDSPYLAPVPHRGKLNEPSYVPHVAAEIARLRGISVEEVAAATTANFFRLFRHAQA